MRAMRAPAGQKYRKTLGVSLPHLPLVGGVGGVGGTVPQRHACSRPAFDSGRGGSEHVAVWYPKARN